MKIVIFGLTVSSSWGNGHATIWRGLLEALIRRKHRVVFFERDVPYYADHRDLMEIPGGSLILYPSWKDVRKQANFHLADADVSMVTSYCPDGIAASELVLASPVGLRVFYDLDTPVTLEAVKLGKPVSYIGPHGLKYFDLVLSYTGGESLNELKSMLGARRTAPLYGSVDPAVHRPVAGCAEKHADLSYLGTYAQDRQDSLRRLFIEPARRRTDLRFLLGGSMYPEDFPWTENMIYDRHIAPPDHSRFYCSSRLTLNVTRRAMAQTGYCPSGRLFEAAACRVPVLSDRWKGLDSFFEPDREILIADTTEAALNALELPARHLAEIGRNARERTLEMHTADCRARELERIIYDTKVSSL